MVVPEPNDILVHYAQMERRVGGSISLHVDGACQGDGARSRLAVPVDRLDGAEVQNAGLLLQRSGKHSESCAYFDGVSQGRPGAVEHEAGDVSRQHATVPQRVRDECRLGRPVWCRQPAAPSVLID